MAEKISVEIGLDGGEEVNRQLEGILQQGQKTFSGLQDAAGQLDFSAIANGFQEVGDTGVQAFDKIQAAVKSTAALETIVQGVKKVEGAFESLGTAATRMGARMTRSLGLFGVLARSLGPVGIAVGVVAGALVKFGNDSAVALNKLNVEAANLDLTAQKFSGLQQALTSLGVDAESIGPGLQQLKTVLGQDFFPQDVITGLQNFIGQLERMPDGVARTQLAMQTLGNELGGQVIAGLQTGTISAQNFAAALGQVTPATQQQIADAAKYQVALNQLSAAWTQLKAEFAPITTPILQFLTDELKNLKKDIGELIDQFRFLKAVFQVFKAGIAGEDVGAAARKAAEEYKNLTAKTQQSAQTAAQAGLTTTQAAGQTTQAVNQTTQALDQSGQAGETAGGKIKKGMQEAAEAARLAAQEAARLAELFFSPGYNTTGAQAIAGGLRYFRDRAGGMAQGGLLGGRGTGTSDSNLAWLSRGEYVTPARAVAQPGVLGFLEALRRSGGNLSRVLDGMGHFALGGLVPRAMPAFAAGGLAGGSNVTIQFPGLPAIGGLRASSSVVDQLHKAAALAQVRSGGRKPSRYS